MKRLLLFLISSIFCLFPFAQHMKFMGIPLDGTISTVTTKLQNKGMSIHPDNKKIDAGCRMFEGYFYGKPATIYIYYDPSTKIVYRGKAVVQDSDYERLKNLYDEIYVSIDSKYLGRHKEEMYKGYPSVSFDIDLETSADFFEGNIDLFFTDNGLTYYKSYSLHIDYYDEVNRRKHSKSMDNDI
ncbi:MAG: hypothetical protein IK100_00500 [Muribaculaceae bacterium]|nr:hypothetical protein [Muribaculaceae bacterium]